MRGAARHQVVRLLVHVPAVNHGFLLLLPAIFPGPELQVDRVHGGIVLEVGLPGHHEHVGGDLGGVRRRLQGLLAGGVRRLPGARLARVFDFHGGHVAAGGGGAGGEEHGGQGDLQQDCCQDEEGLHG
ncbi:hypothetical protein GQ55_6G030100 [Panicum hallii var. hallii]|uniref:Uncharacterized protein n=2 Tax=Panicum hallii TaxID=206008 RepID=A0A2T7D387_9POAL|nr:hypothetical protein GQ55_6G030100 [Panicum hallii var. hallii]PVH36248.1 hypothetical protein PAHAL_6G029900 [Panicum hallii]